MKSYLLEDGLLLIEIIAVSISILALLVTAILATRAALVFNKTFSSFRSNAEPKIITLMNEAEIAQSRAFGVLDKLDILLSRVETARLTLNKTLVLIRAIRDTMAKVSPLMEYVGL
ncbi:MAG: hypothetical protein WC935_08330 [Thermoleophilia bacterium]